MFCLRDCRFACNAKCKEEQNVKVHEVSGKLYLQACENINPGTELLFWLRDSKSSNELDTCEQKAAAMPAKPCLKRTDPKSGEENPSKDITGEQHVSSSGKNIICFYV